MINLLPFREKQQLKMETSYRKVLLLLVFISISALAFVFIIFGLKYYLNEQINLEQKAVLEKQKEFQAAKFEDFKQVIAQTNQNLALANKIFKDQLLTAPLLEDLANLASSSQAIYFTNFNFQRNYSEDTSFLAKVSLSGVSATREDLYQFKALLEKSKQFKDVYFQPSSWVAAAQAEFSVSFKLVP